MNGSVLHVMKRLGQRSETFLAGAIADLDALGWEAWVASHETPVNRSEFPFPPAERFLEPRRPPIWRSAFGRLCGRSARVRGVEWWREVIESTRPDIVHIHFAWAAATVAFERLGLPAVVSFHGSDVRSWPYEHPAARRVYDELLPRLRYAVASSRSIAREVTALGFRGRLEVIHPGVRLESFPFRMPGDAATTRRLLFVGRQVECKGLDLLLTAMRGVVDTFPDTSLVVVGDGPDAERNREIVRSLNLGRNVEFQGSQPHREIGRALQQAQALVVPSRTSAAREAEGHPVAPKEAFAAGVPVIATTCGGIPEVFPPSQRSTLVPENDPVALTQAIIEFFAHPETWRERAVVARTWAEEQFDARRLAERLASLYADMRSEGHPTPARWQSVARESARSGGL